MRKTVFVCLMALAALWSCKKEPVVTTPCGFQISADWIKGTRAAFTVTPDNPHAWYTGGILPCDHPLYNSTDQAIIRYQQEIMDARLAEVNADSSQEGDYFDMFCYKGTRSVTFKYMSPGIENKLVVFQINPKTREAIGPLHTFVFQNLPVPEVELHFTIQYKDNWFRILPSNKETTWFWEYELEAKVDDIYSHPYYFFYDIIDMYDEYGFLEPALSQGDDEWELPRDDRSIREGVNYTMML